jgi:hypothetical protein
MKLNFLKNRWLWLIVFCISTVLALSNTAQAQCTVTATTNATPPAGFTKFYFLTDESGNIINAGNTTGTFTTPVADPSGKFFIYVVTYDNADVPIGVSGTTVTPSNVSGVVGGCSDINRIPFYCRCSSDNSPITVNKSGYNTAAGFYQTYALMNNTGPATIRAVSGAGLFTHNQLLLAGLANGAPIKIYGVNYDATATPLPLAGNTLPTAGCYDAPSYALVAQFDCCEPDAGSPLANATSVCRGSGIGVTTFGNNISFGYNTRYYITDNTTNLVAATTQINGAFTTGATWAAGTYSLCAVNYTSTNPVGAVGTVAPAVGTFTNPACYDAVCVAFTLVVPASAGSSGSLTACSSSAVAISLANAITAEDAGGTWAFLSGPQNPGAAFDATAGTLVPSALPIGVYTFSYSNGSDPCPTSVSYASINVSAQPNAGTALANLSVCNENSALINLISRLSGATGGGTWSVASGAPGANFLAASGQLDPNGLLAGTYTFTYTVTGIAPCINDTEDVSIVVIDQPTAGAGGGTTVCSSSTTDIVLTDLLAGEDSGGIWTAGSNPSGGTFTAASGIFNPNNTANAGTYTFIYTVNGAPTCGTDAESVTVLVNSTPIGNATPASLEACNGGSISAALNASLPSTFVWQPVALPAGVTASGGIGNALSSVVTNSGSSAATFNYNVTVTAGTGCASTFNIPVTVNAQPTVVTSSTPVTCRGGRDGTATATPSGGVAPYSYAWNSAPAQYNQTATSLFAGIYSVTVTDDNGCTNTATVSVSQPATSVAVSIDASSPILCYGGTTTLTASAVGGTPGVPTAYTYLWSNAATTTSIVVGAGTYSVTATDGNGCPNFASITLSQPTPVTCPASVEPATCQENNGSATVMPSGGTPSYTYIWSNGATTATASGLVSGNYSVTVSDANNCTCVNTGINIPAIGVPSIVSNGGINQGSDGGATTFAYTVHVIVIEGGTLPYLFEWDNSGYVRYDIAYSDTGATITIYYSDNATWNVSITDSNGCTSSDLEVSNDGSAGDIALDITNFSVTGQSGTSPNGTINITVGGGNCGSSYSYAWSGPNGYTATSEDISGLASGWYSVTVTCGTQTTQGWYWVPRQRRGRAKIDGGVADLSVMPNPFAQDAMLAFSLSESGLTNISLYSLDGKLVSTLFNDYAQADVDYSLPITVHNIPNGLYNVVLTTATGEKVYYKVILTK